MCMIDINLIREQPELVKENMKKKFQDETIVDEFLKIDVKVRSLMKESQQLRQKRNTISKRISEAKKSGNDVEVKKIMTEAKEIPAQLSKLEEQLEKYQSKALALHMKIPNIMHESVPIGKDDSENVEIKKIGKPSVPDFEIKHHAEIAEQLGGVDFESARKTSGHGFYYLTGDLALLHTALLDYARDYMVKQGFSHTIPPFMIRRDVVEGVMSFEEMDAMMYKIEGEDLYLIGTSEHSMIGRFIGATLNEQQLPITLTSYSPCFRKEVGAHGIEERGLYRLHQFEKQEMIVICKPEDSYDWYEKMLQYTVDIFKSLNIPVRTLECCSGDLANLKAKSADVEAWSPRQKKYYEVGSCSNLTDAQARRLKIKVGTGDNKFIPHTLNNTVVASPRALIALLENNQNADGSITVPTVLQKYVGKKVIGR